MGERGRRQLLLRTKSNQELFELYKAELALRIRNHDNLPRYCQILDDYCDFLAEFPPSVPLAKKFLSQWANNKPATLHKYTGIIKGFLNWYGEDLDLKVKLPHTLPPYVDDADVLKMLAVLESKKTHKSSLSRDALLIELAYNSGLRCRELAKLLVGVIAGTRPTVDYGWLSKDRQVGTSGKRVTPKLYLGVGISGASQHVMGMKDSELIIAINKDPRAPIFEVAEYGIVGDIFEIIPKVIDKLRQIKR